MAGPRAAWTGVIEFGGFPIHVQAFSLLVSKGADSFKTLCKCHKQPIKQVRTCPETGDTIELADTLKGHEVSRGNIVVLDDDAVDAIRATEGTPSLSFEGLPVKDSVPLHLSIAHYAIVPNPKVPGSEGPVQILWNGLHASERALITTWVPRAGSRDGLLAIHADNWGLRAAGLPFMEDFKRDVPEFQPEANPAAAQMFEQFAATQGVNMDSFAHGQYESAYAKRRGAAIEAALKGAPIPVAAAPAAAPAVPDLMAAMEAALAQSGTTSKPKAKAKPRAKAKAA